MAEEVRTLLVRFPILCLFPVRTHACFRDRKSRQRVHQPKKGRNSEHDSRKLEPYCSKQKSLHIRIMLSLNRRSHG